jgi:hypothetical protein
MHAPSSDGRHQGVDNEDATLRAAIREQVGSIIKRLHRNGAVENIGAGRASKWKLCGTQKGS